MIKGVIQNLVHKTGFSIVRSIPVDFIESEKNMVDIVENITNVFPDPAKLKSTMDAVTHVIKNNISGDFVECGVWRGGSIIVMIKMLMQLDVWDRHVYLYDTFEGMSLPTKKDVAKESGKSASIQFKKLQKPDGKSNWLNCPLDEVKANVESIGYPSKLIHYIKGKVEDTLPKNAPDKIALLKLDTNWYQSTKHELEILYPKLSEKGILIIIYGTWSGAKKAVDDYFKGNQIFFVRVDNTARMGMKP